MRRWSTFDRCGSDVPIAAATCCVVRQRSGSFASSPSACSPSSSGSGRSTIGFSFLSSSAE
ncbi:hypothetical protein [uncultured Cloacibacillus sp.]|uniref:hypothetical protein n=1 Tax=uncultured Cloacibacillus sp. TaxID=889794 RepID=UPI00261FFB9C|nr:hypothetical protein [uncultured Cloacibacillus sp.]